MSGATRFLYGLGWVTAAHEYWWQDGASLLATRPHSASQHDGASLLATRPHSASQHDGASLLATRPHSASQHAPLCRCPIMLDTPLSPQPSLTQPHLPAEPESIPETIPDTAGWNQSLASVSEAVVRSRPACSDLCHLTGMMLSLACGSHVCEARCLTCCSHSVS